MKEKKTKSISSKKSNDTTNSKKSITSIKKTKSEIKEKKATTNTKKTTTKKKVLSKIINDLPFQINSFIFYPNEGIGQIIDIEERKFGDEVVPYYVIKFISQKMISRIPTKNAKLLRLRKVISKSYVQKIWKVLEEANTILELPWKDRLQKHQEVLKKGNALETAEMLTSLYVRGLERQLSFQERQYYDFAFDALRDELSIVLKLDNIQTTQSINNSLKKNKEKINSGVVHSFSE